MRRSTGLAARRDAARAADAPRARHAEHDAFVWFYDRYWAERFAAHALALVERLVLPELPPGGRVLDLCCGTGHLAAALNARGLRVTGVDASEEMLRYARRRAPDAELIRADARSFHTLSVHDAVVSTFDSLDVVLSLADLAAVFRGVHAALVPGGLAMFEVHAGETAGVGWEGSYGLVGDDHACVARASFDATTRCGCNDVTMFRRVNGRWRRSDIALRAQLYDGDQIRDALGAAGFADVAAYDAERDLGVADQTGKLVLVAHAER